MVNKEWRPAGWIGQPDYCGKCIRHVIAQDDYCTICIKAYEAGASAMLKAVIKYLMGKCDNPEHTPSGYIQRVNATLSNAIPLRKDCPQCMEQLKGE